MMRERARRLGMLADVILSGALVGISALVNLATTFVFARAMVPAEFGLLSTCRRAVAFVAPVASLGTHLGVTRYIGFYASDARRRSATLAIAAALSFLVAPICLTVMLPLKMLTGHVHWVESLGISVWTGTIALAIATAAGLVVYAILRGFGHPNRANLHQTLVLATFLVIGWGFRHRSVDWLMAAFAGANGVLDLVFLSWVLAAHRSEWVRPSLRDVRAVGRELMHYSVMRIADGPLQASLSLIGVLVAPAIGGLAFSGYVHISQTMVRVTELLVVPLGTIFLPLVAKQVREGRMDHVRTHAQLVYDAVTLVAVLIVVQGMIWTSSLVPLVFGAEYVPATEFLWATLPATLPFLLFASLRSFIDGYSIRPVNTIHLVVAGGVVLLASAVAVRMQAAVGISWSYTLGVTVLGVLSVAHVQRHLGLRPFNRELAVTALVGVLGTAPSLAAAHWSNGRGAVVAWATFAVSQAFVLVLTVAVAGRLRHRASVYLSTRLQSAFRRPAPLHAAASPAEPEGTGVTAPEPGAEPGESTLVLADGATRGRVP